MVSSFYDECVQCRSIFNILNTITITISFYGTNEYIIWQLICLLCTSFFLSHISNVKENYYVYCKSMRKMKTKHIWLIRRKKWYNSGFWWFDSWWRIVIRPIDYWPFFQLKYDEAKHTKKKNKKKSRETNKTVAVQHWFVQKLKLHRSTQCKLEIFLFFFAFFFVTEDLVGIFFITHTTKVNFMQHCCCKHKNVRVKFGLYRKCVVRI